MEAVAHRSDRDRRRALGGCTTGEARITPGVDLPARWVIHAVGPVWRGGGHGEDALLASGYRNSLALAAVHGIRTIAFPAISTGAYGFPLERGARIALTEVSDPLARDPGIDLVTLVCHGRTAYQVHLDVLEKMRGRSG